MMMMMTWIIRSIRNVCAILLFLFLACFPSTFSFILWFYSNDTENAVIRISLSLPFPFSLRTSYVHSSVQAMRAKVDVKLCICSWHAHTHWAREHAYLFCVTKHKLFLQLLTMRKSASSFVSRSSSLHFAFPMSHCCYCNFTMRSLSFRAKFRQFNQRFAVKGLNFRLIYQINYNRQIFINNLWCEQIQLFETLNAKKNTNYYQLSEATAKKCFFLLKKTEKFSEFC